MKAHQISIPDIDSELVRPTPADVMNAVKGQLSGYDCPLCHNKGTYYRMDEGLVVASRCHCMDIRKSERLMNESGLGQLLRTCTFDTFAATKPFQKQMLSLAQQWVSDPTPCFFIGGQPGCGKTHICTAMIIKLIRDHQKRVRYVQWRQDSQRLKAVINEPEYVELLTPLKYTDILYIDDLFKSGNRNRPTQGDLNLAFELINARYINKLPTIISSEWLLTDLIDMDEAIGSRISEMCAGFWIEIAPDQKKNYRLHNA